MNTVWEVDVLLHGGIFGLIMPQAHKGRWIRRLLVLKDEVYTPEALVNYYLKHDSEPEALQKVVHALISGSGLLAIESSHDKTVIDIINLVYSENTFLRKSSMFLTLQSIKTASPWS